jgi:hypothetical protein
VKVLIEGIFPLPASSNLAFVESSDESLMSQQTQMFVQFTA